jgi:AmiR/NasT family two-component response regulator
VRLISAMRPQLGLDLAGEHDPDLIQRLLEQGARAFLTKPLDVKELLELLDAVAAEREAITAG